jgi:hypothetical protein
MKHKSICERQATPTVMGHKAGGAKFTNTEYREFHGTAGKLLPNVVNKQQCLGRNKISAKYFFDRLKTVATVHLNRLP